MFTSVAENASKEISSRKIGSRLCQFGIQFLDDALLGILPNDLVLLGAPSGIGKTQICCNIALENLAAGKRVHFIALEAAEFEIERRLKYQIVASMFFNDKENRPPLHKPLSYDRWFIGEFLEELAEYENRATDFMNKAYSGLNVFYKTDNFDVNDLAKTILSTSHESDLFIIDHAHYFDFDDDNETRALKLIAKTIRTLVLEEDRPVILVAHLRKRDKANEELVAGIDEFHGSSDLAKIATKIITMSAGGRTMDNCYETFFRIPKNRMSGSSSRFIGRMMFDPKQNAYEKGYKVGSSNLTRRNGFEELDITLQPEWSNRSTAFGGYSAPNAKRPSWHNEFERRQDSV